MYRNAAFCVLLIALLGIVAACSDSRESVQAPETTIYRGNGGEPGTLDPAMADDIHAFHVLGDLYEGLVTESAYGELVPGVAESWTVSDDGLVYEFVLRPDARWSDGSVVAADDFVRALRRVANPETASTYGYLLNPIAGFGESLAGDGQADEIGVHALNQGTLRITVSKPTGHLTSLLALSVAYPEHPSGVDATITNGPYVLSSRQPGGAITLTRNPEYRNADSVSIETVVWLPIVDLQTELNMYRTGELDITNSVPANFIKEELPIDRGDLRIAPSLALYYLAFDSQEPPFDEPALRKALSMAIDRNRLVQLLGRGEVPAYGIVPPGTDNHISASYVWGGLPDSERHSDARALYAQAGYGPHNPLKARLLYDTGDVHELIALAVQANWQDTLGAEIELEKREWAYFLDTRSKRDEWDVMRFAWFGDYNSPMTFLEIFLSDSPQNLAAHKNPQFDSLLSTVATTADPGIAERITHEAESMLIDDYPVAPLYFYVSKHLVNPRIGGFEDNVTDRHPSRFLYIRNDSQSQ